MQKNDVNLAQLTGGMYVPGTVTQYSTYRTIRQVLGKVRCNTISLFFASPTRLSLFKSKESARGFSVLEPVLQDRRQKLTLERMPSAPWFFSPGIARHLTGHNEALALEKLPQQLRFAEDSG